MPLQVQSIASGIWYSHAEEATRSIRLEIDGAGSFDQWTMAEITRDLEDLAGSFTVSLRDASRSIATFDYASPPALFRLKPGPAVKIYVDDQLELVGWIETVKPFIDGEHAEVTISGRDKTGDLVDSAALPKPPGEFKNVKLEDAANRITKPFGIKVKNEIDTGKPFPRYVVGLTETPLAAIEKGARQRHALLTSNGTGDLVIARTGSQKAPSALTLPGNMLSSSGTFSHENRFSETIVRGQGERAGGKRKDSKARQLASDAPKTPAERQSGDGSATKRERRGTAMTGRAKDPEIKRHRPIVHLTKAQGDKKSVQDEADWRMRTARAKSEDFETSVHGFSVGGNLWKPNQLAEIKDAFQGVEREMLIARRTFTYDEDGKITTMGIKSPEAFDKKPTKGRRSNRKSKKSKGKLDGTARAL